MNKILPKHSITDAIVAMSDGNPGAATAIMQVYTKLGEFECVRFLVSLDTRGIYGWRIWYAYKYCFLFNTKDMFDWVIK